MLSADGVTVTMKLKGVVGCTVNAEGKVSDLAIKTGENSMTFITNGEPYYVFGKKAATADAGTADKKSPKTGDHRHMALWITLLMLEVFFFDAVYRHITAGPQTKGLGSLIEKHIKTVEGMAAGFFRRP